MKPNLFCAGFPKSATTSAAEWLNFSNKIFVPNIKEPGLYIKNDPNTAVKTIEKYRRLYSNVEGAYYAADFTTTYIYEPGVLNRLAEQTDAKFIGLLRNPNEAANSMFHFNNRLGGEVKNISIALQDEDDRLQGVRLPKIAQSSKMPVIRVCYRRQFQYDFWLNTLSKEVLENTFLATMEGFLESKKIRDELCDFLGVEPISMEIPKLNEFETSEMSVWKRVIAYPPWPANIVKNYIKTKWDISDTNIMRKIYSYNSAKTKIRKEVVKNIFDLEEMKLELSSLGVNGLEYW